MKLRRRDVEAAPATTTRRRPLRPPVYPSGTSLEIVESAWIATGVTRETALTIPAVSACRNLVVGTVTQLGVIRARGSERLPLDWLLSKPDPSTTWPATIAGTVDDLIFSGVAYWLVLERDSEGLARRARWTPAADVMPNTRSTGGHYAELVDYTVAGVDGRVAVEDLIRFDSPLPSVLDVGGLTLSAALELEAAARRLASVEIPAGTLTNEAQEISPDEAAALIATFQAQRRENGVAFLQGMSYSRENLSPADLQLIEARANVATDVARLFNVPVSMIGASPSGNASALLYANLSQQLAVLVSSAVAPYLICVEATLSDVIPRGQTMAFDVQTFLRSDPVAAADYAINLKAAGIVTVDESRGFLGIPPAALADPTVTPGKV